MPGVAWAVLSGIAFGFSQLGNRGVNRQTDALTATTAMVTAMFVALLAASAITGQLGGLDDFPLAALGWFVLAGLTHFLVGWTLFAVAQQRIGPSRTAAVLSTNPVVAALVAALVIQEILRPITWFGVVTVTLGVALVALGGATGSRRSTLGLVAILGTTLTFSISPLFVKAGLDLLDRPLLGLTIGVAVTVPAMHATTRVLTGRRVRVTRSMWPWLALGGSSAGFAIVAQWTAFDLIPVGAVIALQQLNTPVVLFVGPLLLSDARERPDRRMLTGTALIIGGAVVVALFGRG